MNKPISIFIIGIISLFILQSFWLYIFFTDQAREMEVKTNIILTQAMQEEANIRWAGPHTDKENPAWIVRNAKDMTPEERASLKGDTITFSRADKEKLGKTLPEIFAQKLQDDYFFTNPIRMEALDSIFQERLQKEMLTSIQYSLTLYNKDSVAQKTVGKKLSPFFPSFRTDMCPIGTKGLLFVQGHIQILPKQAFKEMFLILFSSFLMAILLIYCLYYQLTTIKRAHKLLEERERTVHNAIHDLKAPLNTVFSILDYTETTVTDTEMSRYFAQGKIQIRKLADTIESMLGLLKNKSNKIRLNETTVRLPETLQQIVEGLRALYPEKEYRFDIQNPDNITTITTDASRLERCLRNLIENALKYSDDGVEITALLKKEDNHLQIAIQDTGWGIPTKVQKRIGEQFFRVKQPDKPARDGFGIGLSSVMQLVKELGGKLTFRSTEGKGSVFFINLPL